MINSFIEAVPVPTILVGANERLIGLNAAARDLIGTGLTGRHYVTALRQPALLDGIEAALRLGQKTHAPYLSKAASRELTWQATIAPVTLDQGTGVLVSFIDMTPMREAGEMRRDFVANVSHELRSPLTALLGFIETLKGAARDDPAGRARFLEIMGREAERMNRLVQDLLSLSRVESQERMRPTGAVDIAGLAASAVLTLTPVAEAKDVTLVIEDSAAPMEVRGDPDQLLQVLTNLIENAIKYGYGTSGGEVQIRLSRTAHDPTVRGPSVTVEVRDRGEGIEPIHIPRLTERFYRVDSHRSREMGGTGLGLAIVKHIINRHRGRLRIESAPGQGTTMFVILPALDEKSFD